MSSPLALRRRLRLVIAPLLLIGAFVAGSIAGPGFVAAAGSAIMSVFITNTTANPVPVNVQGTVAVSGTVATGATSVVLATGSVGTVATQSIELIPPTDVRAYKAVALYLKVVGGGSGELGTKVCDIFALDGATQLSTPWHLGQWTNAIATFDNAAVTFEPAPPFVKVECINNGPSDVGFTFMLVGRSN